MKTKWELWIPPREIPQSYFERHNYPSEGGTSGILGSKIMDLKRVQR